MNLEPARDDTKASVLIVNDEAVIRSALSRMLSGAGFNVTTAASAREALRMLDQAQFDAIVTDIMMPEMDGIELLSRIRQRDRELPTRASISVGRIDAVTSKSGEYCSGRMGEPAQVI